MRAKNETQRARLITLLGALHSILQKENYSDFEQEMLETAELFSPLLSLAQPRDYAENLTTQDISNLLDNYGHDLTDFYSLCENYINSDESDEDELDSNSFLSNTSFMTEGSNTLSSNDMSALEIQKHQLVALLDAAHAISKKKNSAPFEQEILETLEIIDPLFLLIINSNDYEKERDEADLSFFLNQHGDDISQFYDICEAYIESGECYESEDDVDVDVDDESILSHTSEATNEGFTTEEDSSVNSEDIDASLLFFSKQLFQYQTMDLPKTYKKQRDEFVTSIAEEHPSFYQMGDGTKQKRPILSALSHDEKEALLEKIDVLKRELKEGLYGMASAINVRTKHNHGKLEKADRALIADFIKCGVDPEFVQKFITIKQTKKQASLASLADAPSLGISNKATDTASRNKQFKQDYQKNKDEVPKRPASSSSDPGPEDTGKKFN